MGSSEQGRLRPRPTLENSQQQYGDQNTGQNTEVVVAAKERGWSDSGVNSCGEGREGRRGGKDGACLLFVNPQSPCQPWGRESGSQESSHSTLQQSLALDREPLTMSSNALESGDSVLRAVCIVPYPRRLPHEGRHSGQISS